MNQQKKGNKNIKSNKSAQNKFNKLLLLPLLFITTFIYYQSLDNKFLSTWDDNTYVTDNSDIRSLNGDSVNYTIKKIFSTNVAGNYHPLTMLTYSMEYANYKLNPKPYHVTNLLLHLLNMLLVFYFIWLLTKQQWVAFITSLLFAIHPMHVESVAWVSERKDVLYAFFYLAALCCYLLFIKTEKRKLFYYLIMFFLFIAGVLSKAMAVTLPVTFFAIDYFTGRKFNRKIILEKIPFIIVSIVFGYIAIQAQKSSNTMDDLLNYNFFDRILFSSYGIMMYLWKIIAPVNLTCLYSYPLKQGGSYPPIFYIAPLIVLGIFFLIYYSRRFGKDIIFGFGFFLITVALVIQLLPVGAAIIADRYTYLPYIGLFFIVARLINNLLESKTGKNNTLKIPAITLLSLVSIFFCYTTVQRCKIWKDSFTLWNDALKQNDKDPIAYNSRGDAYYLIKDFTNAIADFDKAIEYKNDFAMAHYNRGLAYYFTEKYDEAIADYTKAIESGPKFYKAYSERGNAYSAKKQYDIAIKDFTTAIEKIPNFFLAYLNRGLAYGNTGRFTESIEDFNTAIRIDPKFDEAYFNRGISYYRIAKYREAMDDLLKARQLGYTVDQSYIETIQVEINKAGNN